MIKSNATAWALLVVSDQGQADTLVDQEAWATSTAAAHGWLLTETFSGVSSGKDGARPLTMRMLAQLEATPVEQRPARILMIRLERLGRGDGTEAMATFLRLRALGILIHTRIDGDISYRRAGELLMPMVRLLVGGMENEVRCDKLLTMYKNRRLAKETDPSIATGFSPPYGLTYNNGHLVPKPPEDAAVRVAFQMKGEGYGYHRIGKHLTTIAPPMVLKNGKILHQHWTGDRVGKMLKKTSYRGTIVDEGTWARAQRPPSEITRSTQRNEYPLGGALRCSCGRGLVGATGSAPTGRRIRFYQCRDMRSHLGHMKHYRAERLERQFLALLSRLSADDQLLRDYADSRQRRNDVELLDRQIANLNRELGGIDDRRRTVFAAFEDATLPREQLAWRLDDLKARGEQLSATIADAERERDLASSKRVKLEELRRVLETAKLSWPDAAIDDRRALTKAVANAFGGLIVDLDGTLHTAASASVDL